MNNQTVYLLFAEQTSPFDPEDKIDPLVGILTDEAECLRDQKERPEYKISWEEREVEDAGEHTIEPGDTVYAYHYMAT